MNIRRLGDILALDTSSAPAGGSSAGGTGGGGTPTPSNQGTEGGGSDKTFTQAQVDSIIQERVKKASQGRIDLTEFGFKSKDELKALIDAHNKAEDDKKDEQTRAIETAKKAGRTEAEQELMGKANARLVRSEFMSTAKDKGVIDPKSLYLIAKGEGRLDGLKVTDSDDVEGLDDTFWEEVLKDRDYLIRKDAGTPPLDQQRKPTPGNVNGGTSGGSKIPADRRAEIEAKYPALARRKR